MATKKRWYIEATAHTNEIIAAELPAENMHKSVVCQDGLNRDFWECDWRFISRLMQNKAEGQFAFKVFYREGAYGPVKLWPFPKKRKMTLATALKKGVVQRVRKPALTGAV